jgi:hypothetical protein
LFWSRTLLATALAGLSLPAAARGQEPEVLEVEAEAASAWGFELQVPLLSQYVFRGVVLNDEAVLQPEFFLYREWEDGSWLGAGAFFNLELTDYSGRAGEITEVDWIAEGAIPAAGGSAVLGVAAYTSPDNDFDTTTEAYLAWEYEGELLTSRAELTYDFMEGDGFYARLSASREIELRDDLICGLECGLGAMDQDYAALNVGVAASGLADLGARARLAWICSESSELSLTIFSSFLMDGDYRDAVDDPDPLWFALAWSIAL